MPSISEVVIWEGKAFLGALIVIVVMRLLTGGIRTYGLIAGSTPSGSNFISAGRVQLLIATLIAAGQYLSQVIAHPQTFPEIPQNWLLLLGGSQALYLGSKFHGRRSQRYHV